MARVPVVSRTIKSTEVKAIFLDVASEQTVEKTYTLPRTYKDLASVEKTMHKMYDNDEQRVVLVKSYTETEAKYYMTETKFIELAEKE